MVALGTLHTLLRAANDNVVVPASVDSFAGAASVWQQQQSHARTSAAAYQSMVMAGVAGGRGGGGGASASFAQQQLVGRVGALMSRFASDPGYKRGWTARLSPNPSVSSVAGAVSPGSGGLTILVSFSPVAPGDPRHSVPREAAGYFDSTPALADAAATLLREVQV
jgi:hypothetical protein